MSRAAGVLLFSLIAMLLASCSRPLVSGAFVRQTQTPGVEMFRLVESPRGHISGSYVNSSLNEDGSRKDDEVYNVTGTISESNVTLALNGGVAGFVHWLGVPTTFVGTLKGDTLLLNYGSKTEQFKEVSERQYSAMLTDLQQRGEHIAEYGAAYSNLKHVNRDSDELSQNLRRYVQWAQQRINRDSSAQLWYADRMQRYRVCLNKIRPLAAAHVPTWQWQGCVLDINNDSYDRGQEAQMLRDDQAENLKEIAALHGRITATPALFHTAAERMNAACLYAPKDKNICQSATQTMLGEGLNGLIDERLLSKFQSTASEAERVLEAAVNTSNSEGAKLEEIAQEIKSVYRKSLNN